MADGLNRVILGGFLGADAELRWTPSGQAVLHFRMAINESWLDKDKVKRERVEWVGCYLWGKRGEALAPYLLKGQMVFIEGALRTRSWDKDGTKMYRTDVEVRNVVLGGGKGHSGGAGQDDGQDDHQDAARPAGGGGQGARPAPAAQGAGGQKKATIAPASDRELDGDKGNPTVRFSPNAWKGEDMKGRSFSDCDPQFLDVLAEAMEYSGTHPKSGKEQYAAGNLRDAALAVGWANRRRAGTGPRPASGYAGGNASEQGYGNAGGRAPGAALYGAAQGGASDDGGYDYGGSGGSDDDVPFASCTMANDPTMRFLRHAMCNGTLPR